MSRVQWGTAAKLTQVVRIPWTIEFEYADLSPEVAMWSHKYLLDCPNVDLLYRSVQMFASPSENARTQLNAALIGSGLYKMAMIEWLKIFIRDFDIFPTADDVDQFEGLNLLEHTFVRNKIQRGRWINHLQAHYSRSVDLAKNLLGELQSSTSTTFDPAIEARLLHNAFEKLGAKKTKNADLTENPCWHGRLQFKPDFNSAVEEELNFLRRRVVMLQDGRPPE